MIGLVATLCVTMVACDGESDREARSTPRESTRLTPRNSTLRGVPVSRFECKARPSTPRARPAPIGRTQALLVCPWAATGPGSKTVIVTAGQPQFNSLIAAISAPDAPPNKQACRILTVIPFLVLARSDDRSYWVSIPVDGCKITQRGAAEEIMRVYGLTPGPMERLAA
jgi:hypothetical protein